MLHPFLSSFLFSLVCLISHSISYVVAHFERSCTDVFTLFNVYVLVMLAATSSDAFLDRAIERGGERQLGIVNEQEVQRTKRNLRTGL